MSRRRFPKVLLSALTMALPACVELPVTSDGGGMMPLASDQRPPTPQHPETAAVPRFPLAQPVRQLSPLPSADTPGAVQLAAAQSDEPPVVPPEPSGPPADGAAPASPEQLPMPDLVAEAPSAGLTLPELEQIALKNNPTLRQAQALVDQARGNWVQVGLYPNPSAGYLASEIGNEGEQGQQGAFVSQTIVTADKLDLNRAVVSHDINRTKWQVEAQTARVLNEVRIRYFEALGAQRSVEIAEELQQIAQEGVRVAQQLFDAQQVSRTDVLQAEIQLNQVRILLQNVRLERTAARQQLANVLGIPVLPPKELVGDLEGAIPEIDFEQAWHKLLAASPVLQAARAQADRARTQILVEEVQPIPDIDFQGSVQKDTSTEDTVVGLQVGVFLPLYNRNQGNIAAAVAQWHGNMAEVQRLELILRDRLTTTYQRYMTARNEVERYRNEIQLRARESLALTQEGYRLGEFDFLRVLTVRETLFETNIEYVRSLTNLRQAAVEIEGLLLTGGLGDPAERLSNPGGGGGGSGEMTTTPKTE